MEMPEFRGESTSQEATGYDPEAEAQAESKTNLDYESSRGLLKFNFFNSGFLIFQTAVGISLFTLQKPFNQAGIILGGLITILAAYITTYGLLNVLRLVSMVEKDHSLPVRLQSIESVCKYLKGPHVPCIRWLLVVASSGMFVTSSVSNILLLSDSLKRFVPRVAVILLIYVFILLLLVKIVQPEKIKRFTQFTFAVAISIALFFFLANMHSFVRGDGVPLSELPLFNPSESMTLMGNIIYAFEICSCYLSIRLTTTASVDVSCLTKTMLGLIGLLYFLMGASYSFVFRAELVRENAFEIYSRGLLRLLVALYACNTIYVFITNTIFGCEAIETIAVVRRLLVDAEDRLEARKLVRMRIAYWTATVCVATVSGTDINNFLNFSGSVFSPIVGFIGPITLLYTYRWQTNVKTLPLRKLHDCLYVLVCLAISYFGVRKALLNTYA